MSEAFAQFEKRLDSLERKHRELASGYIAVINPDGLISIQPKEKRAGLALRLIAAMGIGYVLFKSVTLALVGQLTYNERIATLADGTGSERICAWLMQADPISTQLAAVWSGLFG